MDYRCHERDGRGQRCTVVGQHEEITNSRDQRALAHQTKWSLWSTPVSQKLIVPPPVTLVVPR